MAVRSAVCELKLDNSLGSTLDWTATAAAQDTAAGGAVTVTVTRTVAGTAIVAEDQLILDVFIDNGATLVRTINLTPAVASQSVSLSLTADGTSTGSPRCGTLRLRLHAINTSNAVTTNRYNVDSDLTNNTPPTGATVTVHDQGWIRGTTTASTVLPGTGLRAYGDDLTATTTLGAAPFQSSTVNVALGPTLSATASAASTTATFTTTLGTVDNRFPLAATNETSATTFPNATLTGQPFTTATLTETTRSVDPRLTKAFHMQLGSAVWGTPPSSKNLAIHQMLSTQMGFLSCAYTNANGAGVNGLTVSHSLQDSGALTTAVTWSDTTATEGGVAGYCNTLQAWTASKPGGAWNHSATVTAPSGATGLESTTPDGLVMLSLNPLYQVFTAIGPATVGAEDTHWSPGQDLLFGLTTLDTTDPNSISLLPRNPASAKTALNGAQATNTGTLTVQSTSGFPTTGNLYITGVGTLAYTGVTATTFTGVTGGNATVQPSGTYVRQPGAQAADGSIDVDVNGITRTYAIVGRFNQATGAVEGLQSNYTWVNVLTTPPYRWQLVESYLGSRAYVATIPAANTASWGTENLEIVAISFVNATPYRGSNQGEVVKALINSHSKYAFDGPGFVGFPTR